MGFGLGRSASASTSFPRKRRLKSLLRFGKLRNYVTRVEFRGEKLRQPENAQQQQGAARSTARSLWECSETPTLNADLRQLNKNEELQGAPRKGQHRERCKTLTNIGRRQRRRQGVAIKMQPGCSRNRRSQSQSQRKAGK